jgi:hypothetical protein
VIARMPRAATEQHRSLLTLAPAWCNGYASPAWRYVDAELAVRRRLDTENLSTVSRAVVEKTLASPAVAAALARGHNRP